MNDDSKKAIRCSFCGKHEQQVHRMIQGPGVRICDECVHLCMNILEDSFDEMGLSKSDAKKVKKIMEGFYKDLKEAKISAGYELEVTYYVKGSELDEPEERYERTINVYKVDGRWVPDVFSLVENAMSLVMGGVMGGLGDMSDLLGGF